MISLALDNLKRKAQEKRSLKAPQEWDSWLKELFPNLFFGGFAPHHVEFWEHIEGLNPDIKPPAFFGIWSRGGAKSTSVEGAIVRLAALDRRKFSLYIRATQDKANESVQNIAAMLESNNVGRYYPKLATRKLGKYGNSKGWRIDTLRCGNGFNVVALGLDAAVRGIKIEEFRPDLIILDDIDNKHDSPETVLKKIDTLTTSILPAGSANAAIIGIQNLIHPNSIFSQIANGTAEFLLDRIVSGPYPAIEGLTWDYSPEGKFVITGGQATWQGQDLATCQSQMNDWGLTAFLQEAQHQVQDPPGGMFNHLVYRHCRWSDLPDLVDIVCWCDPAVTTTDQSDAMGIQVDGIAGDDTIYRMWSWEQVTTPQDCLRRAIVKALELKASKVGVETDQGGDLWEDAYWQACQSLIEDDDHPDITAETNFPYFDEAKAGAGHGSKVHRANLMLADYEKGRIVHVAGTHEVLERSLHRFPKTKPYDLVDASYWSWNDLRAGGVSIGMAQVGIR